MAEHKTTENVHSNNLFHTLKKKTTQKQITDHLLKAQVKDFKTNVTLRLYVTRKLEPLLNKANK